MLKYAPVPSRGAEPSMSKTTMVVVTTLHTGTHNISSFKIHITQYSLATNNANTNLNFPNVNNIYKYQVCRVIVYC